MNKECKITRRDILEDIARRNDGQLRPEDVVAEATPESHPLHKDFTWNDSVAGHKYRLLEAAHMIRTMKVVVENSANEKIPVRAFYNIKPLHTEDQIEDLDEAESETEENPNAQKGVYRRYDEVMSHDEYRTQLLLSAKREMRAFIRKYRVLEELSGIVKSVDAFIEKM